MAIPDYETLMLPLLKIAGEANGEAVEKFLIDGMQMAGYMIDHGVGVSIASTYEIKKIDSDFFEEGIE